LYVAGGFVRDRLLGLNPKDIDIVVNINDIEAGIKAAVFLAKRLGVYKEGSNPLVFPRFGTAKLRVKISGEHVEIEFVAPRKEVYSDNTRNPDVEAASLKDDALRRDFTVNSLMLNVSTGEIVDFTGKGVEDLKQGVIRSIGTPEAVFTEDPLRILRAIRFALKYNFKLPLFMIQAIKRTSKELRRVSSERIRDELHKILLVDTPSKAIRLFKITGILDVIMPELKGLIKLKQNENYHKEDAFHHTLSVLDNTPPDVTIRLAALFHDIGKAVTRTEKNGKIQFINHAEAGAEIAKEIMKRLKYSNEDIRKITKMVKHHMDLKQAGAKAEALKEKTLRKFVYRAADVLEPLLNLIHADNISHSEYASMPEQIDAIREKIRSMNVEELLKLKPLLSGEEIMELGAKGPLIGEIRARILEKMIENPNFNRADAIAMAKSIISTRKL
ncbi:MAG: CCA tRNA nucleotidyltransferase, partial [Patescibacteria group bacterium]|nr:CCA tRNA nucleotidyltransferase [Patescibacteria group bacterium]